MSVYTPSQDYLDFEAAMKLSDPKWFESSPAAIGYMAWCAGQRANKTHDQEANPAAQPAGELRGLLREWEKLRDPVTLHVSLLRGFPAKLDRETFLHLAGEPAAQPAGEPVDLSQWATARYGVFLPDGRFEELPKTDPVGLNHPQGHTARWVGGASDMQTIRAVLASSPPQGRRAGLSEAEKRQMWLAATIESCSHENCYRRGIADAERHHGISPAGDSHE